jgi:hypothetical protein
MYNVHGGILYGNTYAPAKNLHKNDFIKVFNCEQIVLITDVKCGAKKPILYVLFNLIVLGAGWGYSLFSVKTLWQGSFHFLLQNECVGLVWSKTS